MFSKDCDDIFDNFFIYFSYRITGVLKLLRSNFNNLKGNYQRPLFPHKLHARNIWITLLASHSLWLETISRNGISIARHAVLTQGEIFFSVRFYHLKLKEKKHQKSKKNHENITRSLDWQALLLLARTIASLAFNLLILVARLGHFPFFVNLSLGNTYST